VTGDFIPDLVTDMIYPDFKEFIKLAKKGNVIPVYEEVVADLETPVSAFLKIGCGPYAYLLESVESQENVGRYSFLSADPSLVFESKDHVTRFVRRHKDVAKPKSCPGVGSPLDELRALAAGFKFVPVKGLPRFCGGFVGYIGYDMVRFFERIPDKNPDDVSVPDCVFMLSETLLIFDHVNRRIKIVSSAMPKSHAEPELKRAYEAAVKKIRGIEISLKKPLGVSTPMKKKRRAPAAVVSNMTRPDFKKIVTKAKEYIKNGDIIQVVLSQRFQTKLEHEPFDIYRSLRAVNPSPYMFFLKMRDVILVGSSPELLVRCEDGLAATRPIAGTRPRGKNEAQDEALARELLGDAKEKAEHLMLVDLGRNDLGRVCDYGTVKVEEFMTIEKYSHVMHLVSNVRGRLHKNKDALDALVACFPAGTLSGAPKIRAMEIIDELENARRGPYGGAVAYLSFSGNLDSCIIIRTMVIKDQQIYMQAGAGIVADSDPDTEYNETVNKARALLEAVKQAA
jgi:anthranilate synthase component 1